MIFSVFSNFYTHSLPGLPSLITIFDLIFLPTAFFYLINNCSKIGVARKPFQSHLAVVVLFLLMMVTTLLPYIYFNSILGIKNFEDFMTLVYSLIIFFVFSSYFNSDADRIRKALVAWYLGAIVASAFSLVTIFGFAPSHWRTGLRISGSFKAINQLQSFVAPALIISMFYLMDSRRKLHKILHVLSLLILVLALLATGSRSSILNLLIAVIFVNHVVALRFPKITVNLTIFLCFEILVVFSVIYLLLYIFDNSQAQVFGINLENILRITKKLQEVVDEGDLGPRGEQFGFVFNNFGYYPLGIGHGNFQTVAGLKNEVHNTFLGLLIENGWMVFLCFTLLYFLPIKSLSAIKKDRRVILLLMYVHLEMAVYQMTVYGFRQRIFWIELALIYSAIFSLKWDKNAKNV